MDVRAIMQQLACTCTLLHMHKTTACTCNHRKQAGRCLYVEFFLLKDQPRRTASHDNTAWADQNGFS